MSDSQNTSDATSPPQQADADAALFERLRTLVLGGDDRRMDELAELLPRTIRKHARDNPAELADALREPVGYCIKDSIRQDTRLYADALFPVMGPAIRRAISEALKSLVDSIDYMVNTSLSPRSLMWRWEALRSGQSYASIAMRRSFAFQVEEAFLVHRESGMPMAYAHREGVASMDEHAVSAMLTAIQSFMGDSFSRGEDDQLNEVLHGGRHIWLFHSEFAVLAAVIWTQEGTKPPASLRDKLASIFDEIRIAYGAHFEDFDGDAGRMAGIDEDLKRCLEGQVAEDGGGGAVKVGLVVVGGVLGVLAIYLLSLWYMDYRAEQYRRSVLNVAEVLDRTPGLQVHRVRLPQDGVYRLTGVRDPLADAPSEVLDAQGLADVAVVLALKPATSLERDIVQRRAEALLPPPQGAFINVDDAGKLTATGMADDRWIQRLRLLATTIPGVSRLDDAALRSREAWILQQAEALLAPPEGVTFTVNGDALSAVGEAPRDWIREAASKAAQIDGVRLFSAGSVSLWEDRLASERAQLNAVTLQSRVAALAASLEDTPGIVVTRSVQRADGHVISGLRDPYAATPESIRARAGLGEAEVRLAFKPYQSLERVMVARRVQRLLAPPASVRLQLAPPATLRITGSASRAWIERIQWLAPVIAGVDAVDLSGLQDYEARRLEMAVARLDPPPGIALRMADGVLIAKGEAPQAWARTAADIALTVPGIARYDGREVDLLERRVLTDVRLRLLPPDGVRMAFADGVLTLTGVAERQWLQNVAAKLTDIPDIRRVDRSGLRDWDAVLLAAALSAAEPPPTVALAVTDRALSADGIASIDWLRSAPQALAEIEGLRDVDLDGVVAIEQRDFAKMSADLHRLAIEFDIDSVAFSVGAGAQSATAAIVLDALGALAERLDRPLRVMVIGQTDRRGTDSYNARLRQRRAAAVIERLTELGINPDWLLPARAEWVSPEDAGGQFRRAVFRVLD